MEVMTVRKLALLGAVAALWLFVAALPALADGGPHQVAINSGTSGLHLLMLAAGIGPTRICRTGCGHSWPGAGWCCRKFAHRLNLREMETLKANPILEEVRRIKDQLAAEAGYAADRFFAQLRARSEAHPHADPVVRNAEELRRLAAGESALALKDKSLPKG